VNQSARGGSPFEAHVLCRCAGRRARVEAVSIPKMRGSAAEPARGAGGPGVQKSGVLYPQIVAKGDNGQATPSVPLALGWRRFTRRRRQVRAGPSWEAHPLWVLDLQNLERLPQRAGNLSGQVGADLGLAQSNFVLAMGSSPSRGLRADPGANRRHRSRRRKRQMDEGAPHREGERVRGPERG